MLSNALDIFRSDSSQLFQPLIQPTKTGDKLAKAQPVALMRNAFTAIGELSFGLLNRLFQLCWLDTLPLNFVDLRPDRFFNLFMADTRGDGDIETEEVRVYGGAETAAHAYG